MPPIRKYIRQLLFGERTRLLNSDEESDGLDEEEQQVLDEYQNEGNLQPIRLGGTRNKNRSLDDQSKSTEYTAIKASQTRQRKIRPTRAETYAEVFRNEMEDSFKTQVSDRVEELMKNLKETPLNTGTSNEATEELEDGYYNLFDSDSD